MMVTIPTTPNAITYCAWCQRELTGKIYKPTAKAHRFTFEELVFCNHSEYAAYVKTERESRNAFTEPWCPPNA